MGGAGTGVPPLELDEEPPLDDEDEEELDEDELDEELPELLDVLPEEPKLLEPPVAPELDPLLLDDEELEEDELDEEEPLLPDALLPEEPDEPEDPDDPLLPWLELPCGGLPPVDPPELEDELDEELELLELEEEDELPPVDVEVDPPDVEVEPPEVDVEPPDVEVDPPEVEVELPPDEVETVIVVVPPDELLPPKKPPEKKPPKPPPKPPEPPITIGTPPPLLVTTGGGGGGGSAKTGATVLLITGGAAGAAQATRRTVRRTWRCFGAGRCARTGFALACLTIAGRAGGFSATWTAPPPTTAPPIVQAHSFARAIRTDIISFPFLAGGERGSGRWPPVAPWHAPAWRWASRCRASGHAQARWPFAGPFGARDAASVPFVHSFARRMKVVPGPAARKSAAIRDSRADSRRRTGARLRRIHETMADSRPV